MSQDQVILLAGVGQVVGGLSFSLAMDWLRARPGWPPENSILRWEGWVLTGLTVVLLGIASVMFWLFGP